MKPTLQRAVSLVGSHVPRGCAHRSIFRSVRGISSRISCSGKSYVDDAIEKEVDPLMSLEELRGSLDEAVESEDYERAGYIRDRIYEIEENDPVISMERKLEIAVREERYKEAAELRDQLKELKVGLEDKLVERDEADAAGVTKSVQVTEGVRVEAQSIFVPQPTGSTHSYMFAYKITIKNESHPTTIKLISRKWEIVDQKGRIRVVEGDGVVGAQPELGPGEAFTYQSVCPLETESGSMSGYFEMYSRASSTGQWSTSFLVYVKKFGLDAYSNRHFDE